MPWLRRLVTGLSPWRPGFDSRSVHEKFVVEEVALGKGFRRILPLSPVSIITPMSRDILHLHVATIRRKNGQSLGTFQKSVLLRKSGIVGYENI